MNKILYLLFLSFLIVLNGYSQQILGTCGTNTSDNLLIKQRMLENRAEWKNKVLQRGGAQVYVPVTYWLIAKNDSTGRLPFKNVIENLCCLNKLYSEFNITFYLKDIYKRNNSYIYDDPSSTLGKAYIDQIMQSNYNAINIFVTKVANASELGVLAYYNPQGDYIVCGLKNVNSNCPTLAHEIGHFFSLAHTFLGWESTVYNDITMTCTKPTPIVLPGSGALVEYVDRNKPGTSPNRKNCEEAADGFCDTPADYNLGFGWTGCTYSGCAKDPDDVPLDPSEINLMSYFLDCIKEFTSNQKEAITKDLLSNKRNFLRKVNYTVKSEITDQIKYITPTAGSPALGYDSIRFDWDDVPNAEFYIFDLAENTGFNLNPKSFILKHSDTLLTGFKKNGNYFWRVTPYNSNSFCIEPKITSFRAPVWTVASENIENPDISTYVYQSNDYELFMTINSLKTQKIRLQILNAKGQIVSSLSEQIVYGENNIPLPHLESGFYFYQMVSANRKENTGKFIKL